MIQPFYVPKKRNLWLFLFLGSALLPMPAQEIRRLSPDEAVSLALKNNLSLASSQISANTKQRKADTAWNTFIPTVNLSSTLTGSNAKTTTSGSGLAPIAPMTGPGSPPGSVYVAPYSYSVDTPQWRWIPLSISASWNLNIAMFESMKATRLAYEGGLISHEKAKAQLERDVRKTYYNMLLMQEQIELQRESLAAAERQVETARASYRAGLTPELTWLQAQVDRENKKPQIDQAEKGLKTSMAQFALNLGLSYDTQFELIPMEDPAGFVPLDVQELIAVASAGKPEIMELKNQILQLESSRKAQALSLFTPNLSVQWSTSFGMWDNVNNFHPFKETWEQNPGSLSITLSFSLNNLLPFGSGQQGLKDLEDSLKTARIGLAQAIQGAEIEIYSTILNLAQVQTSLDAQKGTVDLAERTYRLTETAYRNGLRTLVEVQNAELALRTAKSNIVNQQFTYLQGLIDLEYAIGVPFGTLSGRAQ